MQELTPALRRELKARAHALKPVVMIGNDGLTPPVLAEIDRALKSHELIKIRVLGDDRDARGAWMEQICTHTGAQPVQHIGKVLVVHRSNPEPEPARRPARKPGPRREAPRRDARRIEDRPARVGRPGTARGAGRSGVRSGVMGSERREQGWRTGGRSAGSSPRSSSGPSSRSGTGSGPGRKPSRPSSRGSRTADARGAGAGSRQGFGKPRGKSGR